MFHKERCDLCGDCLVKCQWIEADSDKATAWITEMTAGNHTPVVDACITCYACNEFCPTHANPFDLIAWLQEKFHRVSKEIIDMTESKFTFTGELKNLSVIFLGDLARMALGEIQRPPASYPKGDIQ